MSEFNDVVEFVTTCQDFERLQTLNRLVVDQMKTVRKSEEKRNAALLNRGDRVELHHLSPKYLNGLKGVITARDGVAKFVVDLDENQPTGRYGRTGLRIPASALTKIG